MITYLAVQSSTQYSLCYFVQIAQQHLIQAIPFPN